MNDREMDFGLVVARGGVENPAGQASAEVLRNLNEKDRRPFTWTAGRCAGGSTEREDDMDRRMLPATSCRILGICGLALVLIAALPATGRSAGMKAHGEGLLDGKTFTVETGDIGKGGSDKDTLVFRDGMLHSMACDKYGFGDGAYRATEKDGAVYFEAETKSPTKGKISWRGTIRGERLESTYTWLDSPHWYKRSPKPVEKWGRGELKKP